MLAVRRLLRERAPARGFGGGPLTKGPFELAAAAAASGPACFCPTASPFPQLSVNCQATYHAYPGQLGGRWAPHDGPPFTGAVYGVPSVLYSTLPRAPCSVLRTPYSATFVVERRVQPLLSRSISPPPGDGLALLAKYILYRVLRGQVVLARSGPARVDGRDTLLEAYFPAAQWPAAVWDRSGL